MACDCELEHYWFVCIFDVFSFFTFSVQLQGSIYWLYHCLPLTRIVMFCPRELKKWNIFLNGNQHGRGFQENDPERSGVTPEVDERLHVFHRCQELQGGVASVDDGGAEDDWGRPTGEDWELFGGQSQAPLKGSLLRALRGPDRSGSRQGKEEKTFCKTKIRAGARYPPRVVPHHPPTPGDGSPLHLRGSWTAVSGGSGY